jgi:hypothetical protein
VDGAGNVGEPGSTSIIVDTGLPVAQVVLDSMPRFVKSEVEVRLVLPRLSQCLPLPCLSLMHVVLTVFLSWGFVPVQICVNVADAFAQDCVVTGSSSSMHVLVGAFGSGGAVQCAMVRHSASSDSPACFRRRAHCCLSCV